MTQGKNIEHTYWHLFNSSHKSFCWWWQLQDASSVAKLAAHKQKFKSQRLCGPLLWTLSFSSFYRFSTGFGSCDWQSYFLFSLFPVSEPSWEFPWLCVWDHCLAETPTSRFIIIILAVDFYQTCLSTFFCSSFPPPNFTVGVLRWYALPFDLQTWRGLCHPKSSFQSYLTRLFPQYFTGLSKYCSANFKHTSAFLGS